MPIEVIEPEKMKIVRVNPIGATGCGIDKQLEASGCSREGIILKCDGYVHPNKQSISSTLLFAFREYRLHRSG